MEKDTKSPQEDQELVEVESSPAKNELPEPETVAPTNSKPDQIEVIEQKPIAPAPAKRETVYYDIDRKYCLEPDKFKEVVDEKQSKFMTTYKKGNRIQVLVMVVVLVFFVGTIVFMFINNKQLQWLMYLFLGLAVVAFIASMVINSKFKKTSISAIDDYVFSYFFALDSYIYSCEEIKNVKCAPNGKAEDQEIIESHYFDTILSINSRNRITGDFKGYNFTVNDVAVRVPNAAATNKKNSDTIGFYGKYFSFDYKFDGGSFIIIRKNAENSLTCLPTYLDGYEEIKVEGLDDQFLCYATQTETIDKLFTAKVVAALSEICPSKILLDYFVSINALGIKVALNYNDDMMTVPLQTKCSAEIFASHKNDTQQVLNLVAAIVEA